MSAGIVGAQSGFVTESQVEMLVAGFDSGGDADTQARFERGVKQVAGLWRESDGPTDEFNRFCQDNFIADPLLLNQTSGRLEQAFESLYGHLGEMGRDLYWHLSVETGPILPIDYAIARYSPYAHVNEDMFDNRLAFIVGLNFPQYSLAERLELGPNWSRDEWAYSALGQYFIERIPAEVSQAQREAGIAAGNYIQEYNIWMHHVLDENGERPFPAGMKLITHWNLRDELKSQYSDSDGLARQEMIFEILSAIIRQTIPVNVINNPGVDWKLSTNEVTLASVTDGDPPVGWDGSGKPGEVIDNSPEPDTRYERFLGVFHGQLMRDKYSPTLPTLIDRRFQRNREIPEEQVEQLFVSILSSPELAATGKVIEQRLGRKLRPFDIWYDGFKARSTMDGDKLDSMCRAKYPTPEAFEADMPNILVKLGFDQDKADYLATKVVVDPSRGAGHASGPGRPVDQAHLRTRVGADGMDYKGYNIAVHEFGHNVEQVFSTCRIDHSLLGGVPNTAFTEGFAFVFQARDLELLGLPNNDPNAEHLKVLDDLWSTAEIAAVSLVDMRVWHWMYEHPDAKPAQLKEGVIGIAKAVWNEYYASIFGIEDVDLLAVYSHMISGSMYLPDYPLGHIIAFQVKEYFKTRRLGPEMERMCLIGAVTPNHWMQLAVGNEISTEPMLSAAAVALPVLSD
jgi:hypothetical protein